MAEIISKSLPDQLELTISGKLSNFLLLEDYNKEFVNQDKILIVIQPGAELTILERSCKFSNIEIILLKNSKLLLKILYSA